MLFTLSCIFLIGALSVLVCALFGFIAEFIGFLESIFFDGKIPLTEILILAAIGGLIYWIFF